MAKLDAKQQLAVREILEGLRAAVGRVYPALAGAPLATAEVYIAELPDEPEAKAIYTAIRAARELDAAH